MRTYQTITVSADSDIYSLEDLEKLSEQGDLTMAGSGGIGSNATIVYAGLVNAGLNVRMVPYPGASQAAASLMGGHTKISSSSVSGVKSYVEDGTLRVLAVASDERVEEFPDVPTLKEEGYDIVVPLTSSLFAPPGTSMEIVEILENAFKEALNHSRFSRLQGTMNVSLYTVGHDELKKLTMDNYEMVKEIKPMLEEVKE
jgi:tripartite-type tricarboxylate transporter receptor subunit TctC